MSAAVASGNASATPLVVRNLSVGFRAPRARLAMPAGGSAGPGASGASRAGDAVVRNASFEVAAGECLAIVGESGSGKSVTARSLLGLAGPGARVDADELSIGGRPVLGLRESEWRTLRGRAVGLVLQDALVSFDPLRPIGREIGDSLRLHTRLGPRERALRVQHLLRSVGLPDGEERVHQRSGELSGGQRQRALIASAIALDPPLLVADEPTTALDVTVQAQILDLMREVKARGTALLLISHDLSVVGSIADRIAVMSEGRIIETGTTDAVLGSPGHELTRRMIAAVPSGRPRGSRLSVLPGDAASGAAVAGGAVSVGAVSDGAENRGPTDSAPRPLVLEAVGLSKSFSRPGRAPRLAVDDVSFELERGTTLGIVGESGSGKTTTARLVLALTTPDSGDVRVQGRPWTGLHESERRPLRPALGAIYQDALSSFDPRHTVADILRDAVTGAVPGRRRDPATDRRVAQLIDSVGLPTAILGRRALAMSGGQRQRVGIARALASDPAILVCDEPVSSLDVSVQAQVLDLLDDLQRELDLSLLFISHDLGVIQHVSDRVAVMKDGRIVETGAADAVFRDPRHPYTRALLSAVPRLP